MATSREIVAEAFSHKKPERVPAGVCLGGSWPFFIEGVTLEKLSAQPPAVAAEIFYRVMDRVDADLVTVGTGATAFLIEALGGKIAFTGNGAPEITSLLIACEADIDALNIENAFKSERLIWLREVARETVRLNQGKRSIFVSGRAPFTLAGQLLGLETLSKSLYKNKPLVEKLLRFTTDLSVSYYKFMLETEDIDGIFIADPSASGDVVSSKHFGEIIVPRIAEVLSRLAPLKKLSLLHICGDITDRLHLLEQTGVQMISVDSKVDLAEAKRILGGKIGLSGNANPVFVLEEMTADEVYGEAVKCMDSAATDGGFILLPGCDLSAKAPEENVRAYVRAAHEWRG